MKIIHSEELKTVQFRKQPFLIESGKHGRACICNGLGVGESVSAFKNWLDSISDGPSRKCGSALGLFSLLENNNDIDLVICSEVTVLD